MFLRVQRHRVMTKIQWHLEIKDRRMGRTTMSYELIERIRKRLLSTYTLLVDD